MKELSAALLGKACRIFLDLAYAGGEVPSAKRPFVNVKPEQSVEPLLAPPLCQLLPAPEGGTRGYAFRLGCRHFPHMKLQVVDCDAGAWIFGVDTHDAMKVDPGHPDAARWLELQAANRKLKQQIERAWEDAGLMTFNVLLRIRD